jgi:hypothetical protein
MANNLVYCMIVLTSSWQFYSGIFKICPIKSIL